MRAVILKYRLLQVNLLLYDETKGNDKIDVKFNHKLVDMDLEAKTLTFQVRGQDGSTQSLTVAAHNDRVLAADGLYSKVRRVLDVKSSSFKSDIRPWTNEFRVVFAPPGEMVSLICIHFSNYVIQFLIAS